MSIKKTYNELGKSCAYKTKPGFNTQGEYDKWAHRRNKRIKKRRKTFKFGKVTVNVGCQPLSRFHPDHPKHKEFNGTLLMPNLEAGPNQEFQP